MSREEIEILKWFKRCACVEQELQNQVNGLTDQVNLLSRNLNTCTVQLNHKHHCLQSTNSTLNVANKRLQDLEQAFLQSERSRAICENELQSEKNSHSTTKDYLAQEFENHHRAAGALVRQGQAMKNLSDFLELMQGTSDQAKEATVQALTHRDDMGTIMLELEDKKQALAELEDQRKLEHTQFENTTKYYREQSLKHHQYTNTEINGQMAREINGPTEIGSTEEASHEAAAGRRVRSKRLRAQRGRVEGGTYTTYKTEDQTGD
ncbi:MAG: hypothetical protein L6R36_008290 [Xanthoria steineri]|nr:MAG: hypothetical protein L6R36_008290 [Xanthoria steineri]